MDKFRRHRGLRRFPCGAAGCALLAAFLASQGGCRRGPDQTASAPPPNIIVIVIDTLRADHLGCHGYFRDTSPNINTFAAQALFFEQAYAPMATTLPSHTSLFTGLYPLEHGSLANVGDDGGRPFRSRPGARSIVELAQAQGYRTAAFVSGAPLKRVCGLNAGFETYDAPRPAVRKALMTTNAALAWLEQHAQERFFLFVHYFDPHVPYLPPPPYHAMFRADAELQRHLAERAVPDVVYPGLCRGRSPTVTRQAMNLYDGEVRFCDAQVGRLLDWLRQRGLWDRSVIILTADHGEGLNQHEWPQHGRTWNEQVHVPLMIRFPGARSDLPQRFKPLVSLVDVFPTVLGQLEVRWAQPFLEQARGVDVLAPGFEERAVLSQRSGRDCGEVGGPLYALTTPDWRYHFFSSQEELLFDRRADPHELRNAAADSPAQAQTLRQQTLRLVAELEQHGQRLMTEEPGPLQLDPQLRREMEALGYMGDGSEDDAMEQPPASSSPSAQPAATGQTREGP
jgi:arylsulfatase